MWEQGWLTYSDNPIEFAVDFFAAIHVPKHSEILDAAIEEVQRAGQAICKRTPSVKVSKVMPERGIAFVMDEAYDDLGPEGYRVERKASLITITGMKEVGLLYGVFGVLRMLRTGGIEDGHTSIQKPSNQLRMLNHWDNMDGSIERGYSGDSFFFEDGQIIVNERIKDYARLTASVGINGVVINNVNVAGDAIDLITERYRNQLKAYVQIFKTYGIKLFLSLDYAAPMDIGGMSTCDPLDKEVQEWWQITLEDFYKDLPDVGGFLIKADSEGRPGPFTYNRSHADGANMLARILKPYGSIVLWRCFVYNCMQDWRDITQDRARAGFDHFMPLDGSFEDNVILQVKNGPMDFQVREPVSPLFGAMEATNQLLELQIAQEYTGQQRHVCYLVPMWKEILDFRTRCKGAGDSVADVVAGRVYPMTYSGIAAVANTGRDSNWTGHDLAAANYYGYGRLIWDTSLTAEEIAKEWIAQTFNSKETTMQAVESILMNSWPAYEKYTSPLGIGWMVNRGHHYGPNVDGYEYDRWGTYHKANHEAIGVDRTFKGTGYAEQYFPENVSMYSHVETCPETLLLFFHRIPYTFKLSTNKTLIQHIYDSHFEGVESVEKMVASWETLEGDIDPEVHQRVKERFAHQLDHAGLWRDTVNSYFYRMTLIDDDKARKIY